MSDNKNIESGEDYQGNSAELSDISSKLDLLQELKDSEAVHTEEPQFQCVVIALDSTLYGIQLLSVREILKVPKITWLPCSPAFITGVISVRGNIQAVVDLKIFLQLGCSDTTDQSRIILVESGELITGLLIDEMIDIITVPESAFIPFNESAPNAAHGYLKGRLAWQDKQLTLLNIDAIVQGVIVEQA
ncbi:hypothetical protein CSA56_11775 [candidate division KSB3 bacterium]|uniref:CheW-like domain-containing protein n=1 Tax=candidate division KSB3 bacterium TaxID=2044937 RepID=A0A2G6KCW2_9BACT|nr:MAG: hypothetical protein CSA56_11775 [candidate division KSB3 bacterium]